MSAKIKFNEGKACDAVIRRIEAREGFTRKDVRFPEQENHAAPVELVCAIGSQLYAFEHTGIEPFAGHVRLQVEVPVQLEPIEAALIETLPTTEDFELRIPLKALEGIKGQKLRKIQQTIIRWIKDTALTLPIADIGRNVLPIHEVQLPGVPFKVSLHRRTTGGYREGMFYASHSIEGTIESERLERIREGYNKKVSKLAKWHRDVGARSILILEDRDVQLTNPERVAAALIKIEQDATEKPNEIYLVSSITDNLWWISAMRIGDRGYYSLAISREMMTEIKPDILIDLTKTAA